MFGDDDIEVLPESLFGGKAEQRRRGTIPSLSALLARETSFGSASANQQRGVGEQKCGEAENPCAGGDMHERRREVGQHRNGEAGAERDDNAKVCEDGRPRGGKRVSGTALI